MGEWDKAGGCRGGGVSWGDKEGHGREGKVSHAPTLTKTKHGIWDPLLGAPGRVWPGEARMAGKGREGKRQETEGRYEPEEGSRIHGANARRVTGKKKEK